MNNTLNLALRQTARSLSVDQKLVENIYKSYWRFIKEQVSSIRLSELSKEEFDSRAVNINIPYLGKLYPSYNKVEKYKRHLIYCQNAKIEKNKADRLSGISD